VGERCSELYDWDECSHVGRAEGWSDDMIFGESEG